MKLKLVLYIWITLIHILLFILSIQHIENLAVEFIVELSLLLSIIFIIVITERIFSPLKHIRNGMEAINEQDFNTQLSYVGVKEVDDISKVYNRIVSQLRDERITIREQHHFLDLLINAAPVGIVILDFDENIEIINPKAVEYLNPEKNEIHGKSFLEQRGELWRRMRNIEDKTSEIVRLEGKQYKLNKRSFMDKGFERKFYFIEELTNELYLAEKKAYEKLIRIMSHEVNNSTGAINSILSTIQTSLRKDGDKFIRHINAIDVSNERINNLNEFMTNFARVVKLPEPSFTKSDLYKLLNDCKLLIESQCIERNISINLENRTKSPVIVSIDTNQIEQVVINILKNAVEAIKEGGEINICLIQNPISVSIRNSGTPISEEEVNYLFTPFYTTKPEGQGIGLMLIRQILTAHNCKFHLKTLQSGITEFFIEF